MTQHISRLKGLIGFGHSIRDFSYTTFAMLAWVPALIFFNTHVGEPTIINGPSMYPSLNAIFDEGSRRDICLVSKWNAVHNLRKGMIVVFRSPYRPEGTAVKRIIALEHEKVETREPYPLAVVQVPTGHVWVEGDNEDKTKTLDSNDYGPIAVNLITGKVTHVLYPWNSFGPVRWWAFKGRTKVWERGSDD